MRPSAGESSRLFDSVAERHRELRVRAGSPAARNASLKEPNRDLTITALGHLGCSTSHLLGHRGQALGYMGELERACQDFDQGVALAREHGDPEAESYRHANIAMLRATARRLRRGAP